MIDFPNHSRSYDPTLARTRMQSRVRLASRRPCVWRWQERFATEGFEGLLRDKARPSRIKPLGDEVAARIVALTLDDPPGETTHWTGALMAKPLASPSVPFSASERSRASAASGAAVQALERSEICRQKLRDVVGALCRSLGECESIRPPPPTPLCFPLTKEPDSSA
jgi:hypothetical protein